MTRSLRSCIVYAQSALPALFVFVLVTAAEAQIQVDLKFKRLQVHRLRTGGGECCHYESGGTRR